MSQEQYEELKEILNRLEQLEKELKTNNNELVSLNKEIDKLRDCIDNLKWEVAPMIEHMDTWDKRDLYIYKIKRFIKHYIYTPIHFGFRATFVIIVKLSLTLLTGLIAGVLLNIIGVGNLIKNIIDFLGNLF